MKRLLVLALLFVLWPSLAARAENEPSGTVDPEDLPSHPVPPGDVAAPPLGAPALPRCDDSARGAGEARYREEAIGFTDLVDPERLRAEASKPSRQRNREDQPRPDLEPSTRCANLRDSVPLLAVELEVSRLGPVDNLQGRGSWIIRRRFHKSRSLEI